LAKPIKVSRLLDLRYQAEYVGLRFLIGLVRLLPLDRGVRHLRQDVAVDCAI
jgi:hypothetical protein